MRKKMLTGFQIKSGMTSLVLWRLDSVSEQGKERGATPTLHYYCQNKSPLITLSRRGGMSLIWQHKRFRTASYRGIFYHLSGFLLPQEWQTGRSGYKLDPESISTSGPQGWQNGISIYIYIWRRRTLPAGGLSPSLSSSLPLRGERTEWGKRTTQDDLFYRCFYRRIYEWRKCPSSSAG